MCLIPVIYGGRPRCSTLQQQRGGQRTTKLPFKVQGSRPRCGAVKRDQVTVPVTLIGPREQYSGEDAGSRSQTFKTYATIVRT